MTMMMMIHDDIARYIGAIMFHYMVGGLAQW